MASIDDVIARAREPGEFTERREFTVARGQAIKKLRKFALVEQHYYILELIQSAVANGATYIDIQCDRQQMTLSYIGGHFSENALAQLFDFLFAAEDDLEHGALRQLALGVNALMSYEPDEIIVESGNGTPAGTSRIAIRGEDRVEVGRPDKPLEGTFIRANGMSRSRFSGKPPEYRAVEDRCLVAPVPILFNQEPVFGYSSQRTPKSLFGFGKTVSFDEGDLYGTIGIARRHSGAVFRLLTHGVWIESTRHSFEGEGGEPIKTLGGVVTFDRLRKTADHSSIVEDERYEEMWIRLQPYVNQLVAGAVDDAGYNVTTLGGGKLENRELIEVLRQSDSVVLAPPTAVDGGADHEAAHKIGESLGIPVLCVGPDSREAVQTLGGRDVDFVVPDLSDDKELHFYTRNEAPLPPRPWLTAPVDLGRSSLLDTVQPLPMPTQFSPLRARLSDQQVLEETTMPALRKAAWLLGDSPGDEQSIGDWKQEVIDPLGECIHATIYTPEQQSDEQRATNVQVRTAGRVVWQGDVEAVAPGQMLIIDVADIAPRRLWNPPKGADKPVARLIAEGVVHNHLSELEQAADRGLRAALRADVQPNTSAAQLVLASLAQRVVKRIHGSEDQARVGFSIVDSGLDVDVLQLPLLCTIDGTALSLRDLEQLMQRCHGLFYAVRADIDADLDGLDRSRILVVDEVLESILISLVGPTAYVRVDDREVLVEYDGVQCRDVAVGLREYPEFPLLVEGDDPSRWDEQRRRKCVDALVTKLIQIVQSDGRDFELQELRRQAWRHLQWFAVHADDYEFAREAAEKVKNLPLFGLSRKRTCSPTVLDEMIQRQGHVEMLDGWAVGATESSFDQAVERQIADADQFCPDTLDFELQMDPFVLHLLGDVVEGVADYHLSEKEMEAVDQPQVQPEAMLEQKIIDNREARGVVGVPQIGVERPAVVVFSDETRQTVLRDDIGETFGVVGKIRLRKGVAHDDVEDKISGAAREVLSHLLARLPELAVDADGGAYNRALTALLEFAAGQVQLVARQDMTVVSNVRDPLALEILNAPLFPADRGTPISAVTLYHDFQDQAGSALATGRELEYRPMMVADDLPDALERWIRRHLRMEHIHRPACYSERAAVDQNRADENDRPTLRCVEKTLEHWINALHPDTDVGAESTLHIGVVADESYFSGVYDDQFCRLMQSDDLGNYQLVLAVHPDHWMTRWMSREGDQTQRAIAWPILAAYGHINARLDAVTNDHELICQQRVGDAMHRGRLAMVRA